MTMAVHIWMLNKKVEIRTELNESVAKISNIGNHLYLQTVSNSLYHGIVETEDDCSHVTLELSPLWKVSDLDCCRDSLFLVDTEGNVHKCNEALEMVSEVNLIEDSLCCRGHTSNRCKMKVNKLAVGDFGCLFVTDTGQLWASGCMPQIGVDSKVPRRVSFFVGRLVYSVSVGSDFAIAIVSKQTKDDGGDSDEEEGNRSNCPQCLSASQLTSPASQTSISELCPLGMKVQGSYDIETTSTSSKNDMSSSSSKKTELDDEEELETSDGKEVCNGVEKNIIFRNTEAAKEFLTRQISRMSSAGEEYLVECTEKPTRIIKENMTNVASFVYEGVKTVGGKVATLSRHVSGSSDCNISLDNQEEVDNIPRSASRDDCVWSLSQCTSERDISEHEIKDRLGRIAKVGSNLINCEVWTWGNIVHGQLDRPPDISNYYMPNEYLNVSAVRQFFSKITGASCEYELPSPTGIGDIIKRERPMIITKLSNIGVRKASVQNYHAGVLTLDGRAFFWGRNDHNQVTMDTNIDQSSPKLHVMIKDERVKDLVCGEYYTAMLSNGRTLVYSGRNVLKTTTLHSSDSNVDNCDSETLHCGSNVAPFRNLLSTSQYTLLNVISRNDSYIDDFLVEEQKFLEEMLLVQTTIIKPMQKKTIALHGEVFERLCRSYLELLYFCAANVQSFLEYSNCAISLCDVALFKYLEEFVFAYRNYADVVMDVISIDGFQYVSKLIEIPQSVYKTRPEMFTKKDRNKDELMVETLLSAPSTRMREYCKVLQEYATKQQTNNEQKNSRDLPGKWNEFVEEHETKQKQAEATREFWLNSGKAVDFLKVSERRLIRDSHRYPIHLQNASRFSSHWFVLFSDLFVHINGSSPHLHNLTTIWLEQHQDETTQQYQICMKMPEETLVLYTNEAEVKMEWFHALQNAIKSTLNKSDAMQPPAARSGTYCFVRNGFLKDAVYTGRWFNGKMQGHGKLQWNDGKVYTGHFGSNQLSGYGVMEIPNVGSYEGQWRENQQNGPGTFTYANTDVYKGHFKDGQPHGHGFLRKGNFMANAASFYIGDWISGMKNGYGVMDDIVNGEKYIGNWMDNKKHGNGLIVTSDGVYYEGVFNQDTLTGQGVMILEDGTHYEGEFRGTGVLNGKGTLTLQSGHIIEGTLSGSWNEGIKISNGVLTRNPEKASAKFPKEFCPPVHQKWKALFKQCHQVLGIPESASRNGSRTLDTHKIWQNVAVYLSNSPNRKGKNENLQNSLNNLDIIPPFGRERLDLQTYLQVKNYLAKAFETSFHPLGSLLTDLSEAYTTTYGGRAHPLLLDHAISELHYVCKRLYEIVRFLFPALPAYDTQSLVEKDDDEEVVNYQSLLYPLILPKVHHPLFTLFAFKNEQQERQYKRTLMEWNKQSDYTLMAFLSVDQKFFRMDEFQTQPPVKDHIFGEAIETLQQLKSTFSPIEKLLVIRETVTKMTPVAQEMQGKSYVWNMDDLFPMFLFVVVRSRIPDLGSELDFMDNFMDPSWESGELGIMYTTLKASYKHILQEKSSTY